MYLLSDKIVVTIKNTVFRSYRLPEITGQFVLDPTAITGWSDGTATRRDATRRAASSGDFSEPATMSSRLVTLSGTAVAGSSAELQSMRDEFIGLLSDGSYHEISVETSVGTRYATFGLEGTPSWIQMLDNVAVFKIDLYAPDAHIYGVERVLNIGNSSATAGGGLTYQIQYPLYYFADPNNVTQSVRNDGNSDAWPVFRITGDYTDGFSLFDNVNSVVTYSGPVSMFAPVEIDMGRGTAIQNGVDKTVNVSQRQWFSISPGQTMRPSFIPLISGSGWCDILIRDTWI